MSASTEHFLSLHALLASNRSLWQPSPYIEQSPAWMQSHSSLAAACLSLDDQTLTVLETNPSTLITWLEPHLPQFTLLTPLLKLASSSRNSLQFPARWNTGIKGRKALQIQAFASALQPRQPTLVDWCSGKAHLGRTLAQIYQKSCVALERNLNLCIEGAAQAKKQIFPTQFINTDVLQGGFALPKHSHIIALHACGDLHRKLVLDACAHSVASITLAPCCYPLWLADAFTPLSKHAQTHNLMLDRNDLHLAVQESVTASARSLQQANTLAAWRLGFDALQRELRGTDAYLQTPSLPLSAVNHGFEHCCRVLAQAKNLIIHAEPDWQHFEKLGFKRQAKVRRLQLVRHAFRRALELWLVLDLVMYLEEHGYKVTLTEFCERTISPRNLLIDANI